MKVASKLFLRLHTNLHTIPRKLPANEIDFFKKCFTLLKFYGPAIWPRKITHGFLGSNPIGDAIFILNLSLKREQTTRNFTISDMAEQYG